MAGITIIVLHKMRRCDEPEDNFEVFVFVFWGRMPRWSVGRGLLVSREISSRSGMESHVLHSGVRLNMIIGS